MTRYEYVKTVLEPRFKDEDELYHHGIIGMKWGVRRYQNEDGSLTPEGERRYYQNDKGKFVKRTKKELKEYDDRKTQEYISNFEIYNRKDEPASDFREFNERMDIRWWDDPEVKKLRSKWREIDNEVNDARDTDGWETDAQSKAWDKAYNDMVDYFDKYKSKDMNRGSVEAYVDDWLDTMYE